MTTVDAAISRMPLVARTALAGLVLCGLIIAMVVERASILRNGATIRLATTPVDPRDLFRGDYVVLGYQIGTINLTKVGSTADISSGETVYVGVKAGANGQAEAARLVRASQPRDPALIWLKGTASRQQSCLPRLRAVCSEGDTLIRVTYGLESYFVPEGQGRAIETTPASRVEIVAAVSTSGMAAIKSLLIDGKPVYDEPPF